ncbi:MAG TPA: GNAT family protein [Nitriliruptorales bacterium]
MSGATPPLPQVRDALVGDLVRLRPPTQGDIHRIWECQDWEGARLGEGGAPVPRLRSETEDWLLQPFQWDKLHLVIDPLDDAVPIAGRLSLGRLQWPEATAMLGMSLLPDSRRKGYGIDALRVLCAFAFEQLNLHKISLGTWAFNEAAQALYRKVGFVVEGRERDFLFRDGAYHDSIAMGLLASEWRAHPGRPA